MDARKLYAREAAPSMFAYCTEVLLLSEHEAYLRITAARASREHPVLLAMLRDGRLHLSGIALLSRYLTDETRNQVLKRAAGLPHRQLKELAAELEPKPDVPSTVRRLPVPRTNTQACGHQLGTYRVESPALMPGAGAPLLLPNEPRRDGVQTSDEMGSPVAGGDGRGFPAIGSRPGGPSTIHPGGVAPASVRRAIVDPLSPNRYRVQFTADAELREMLERLRALMRSSVPDGDLAAIIKVAVAEKLERLEAKRFAKTKKPRKTLADTDTTPKSRDIPAAIRRVVHERDGGRCTYRDRNGRRCTRRHDLEFHHREPFGLGGDHRPDNVALMCNAHNALMAEHDYGKEVMWRHRRSSNRSPTSSPSSQPSLPVFRRRGHG